MTAGGPLVHLTDSAGHVVGTGHVGEPIDVRGAEVVAARVLTPNGKAIVYAVQPAQIVAGTFTIDPASVALDRAALFGDPVEPTPAEERAYRAGLERGLRDAYEHLRDVGRHRAALAVAERARTWGVEVAPAAIAATS